MEMMHMGWGFGLGFLNFLGTILFFIFLFWVFKAFVFGRGWRGGYGRGWRHMKSAGGPWGRSDDATEAARERYARGDISKEQYEAIKTGLESEKSRESHDDWRDWRGFWNRDKALEVARVRFARGEISLEEYQAIKQGLEG